MFWQLIFNIYQREINSRVALTVIWSYCQNSAVREFPSCSCIWSCSCFQTILAIKGYGKQSHEMIASWQKSLHVASYPCLHTCVQWLGFQHFPSTDKSALQHGCMLSVLLMMWKPWGAKCIRDEVEHGSWWTCRTHGETHVYRWCSVE